MFNKSDSRRRFVRTFAPAVGVLAAGLLVWQGSYAAFTATTTDNGNTWATGNLTLENNGGGNVYSATTTANFGGTGLVPTASGSECLTVANSGSLSGNTVMYATSVSDTTTSGHDLSDAISVDVTAVPLAQADTDIPNNCTGFGSLAGTPVTVASGVALSAFANGYAAPGAVQVAQAASGSDGDRVAYKLTWTFNSTGSNLTDNALQGKSATADFTWEIQ
jgi:hypothetical protein